MALVCVSGNNIGVEGAKALGPHLAKLTNVATLHFACACCCWFLGVHCTRTLVGSVASMISQWLYGFLSQQAWRGRRHSTRPAPGEASQHDNAAPDQCVFGAGAWAKYGMCWSCGTNGVNLAVDVRQQTWRRRRQGSGPIFGEAHQHDSDVFEWYGRSVVGLLHCVGVNGDKRLWSQATKFVTKVPRNLARTWQNSPT